MPNNCTELWPMLRVLWPERCSMSLDAFRSYFCDLEWSIHNNDWKVVGNKKEKLPELRAMLAGTFLRRLKDQLKLPPIRFETMVLPGAGADTDALLDSLDEELRKLIDRRPPDEALAVLAQHKGLSAFRRLCGLAKVAATAELLELDFENGMEKVVVFAHHLDVLHRLRARLQAFEPVMFTGSVSADNRQRNVQRFQTDPDCRVALCQIQAGGVGITLTAASEVVFVEQSWTPADNAQAADRCHRIGQSQPVRVRFLSLAGTVDELVAETLARKSRMIAEIGLDEESSKTS
jgi:SWI/SNF-related matrix-associated actin-dependent regulator 1 of chromatin subfamily A